MAAKLKLKKSVTHPSANTQGQVATPPNIIMRLNDWISDRRAAFVIALVALATYASGLASPFWQDDNNQIVNNLVIHSLGNVWQFFNGGTFYDLGQGPYLTGAYYRPLMTLAYSMIYAVAGNHSWAYHLVQLGVAATGTYVLYLVFRYSFSQVVSLILALVFLVHPLDSQVVFAIPSLQDAMYFAFGVTALWLLLRYESVSSLWLVCGCLLASMLSKETGVFFVVLSILYLLLFDQHRLKPFAGMVTIPLAIYGLLYRNAYHLLSSPLNTARINDAHTSLITRLITAPSVLTLFLGKLIWPAHLATGYYWLYDKVTFGTVVWPLIVDVIVIGALITGGLLLRGRASRAIQKTYWFFIAWFLLGISVTLQLVPLDMTACETWFYFSMAGLLGALTILAQQFISVRWRADHARILLVATIAVILTLAIRTSVRGLDWENSIRLERTDLDNSPQDYVAAQSLGELYSQAADYPAAVQYDLMSIKLYPVFGAYSNLGLTYTKMNKYPEALAAYKTAIQYGGSQRVYENAGALALNYADPNYTQQLLTEGTSKYPLDPQLWLDLAMVYAKERNLSAARGALYQAERTSGEGINPSIAAAIYNGQPYKISYGGKVFTIP